MWNFYLDSWAIGPKCDNIKTIKISHYNLFRHFLRKLHLQFDSVFSLAFYKKIISLLFSKQSKIRIWHESCLFVIIPLNFDEIHFHTNKHERHFLIAKVFSKEAAKQGVEITPFQSNNNPSFTTEVLNLWAARWKKTVPMILYKL